MPNLKSAKKRLRQNETRAARNRTRTRTMKQAVRAVRDAANAGDNKKARELLPVAQKAIDKATHHGPLHKNTATRKKQRLAAYIKPQDSNPNS